jgi:stage III sporulation protein AH
MKRIVFKRNQVIITALVAMIAVAGYLNWRDSQQEEEYAQAHALDDYGMVSNRQDRLDELDLDYTHYDSQDQMFMDAPWTASEFDFSFDFADELEGFEDYYSYEQHATERAGFEAGEAVFVSASDTPSFFVQARLDREQSRSRQTDILMNMMNEQSIDTEQRAVITDAMLEIQRRIENETATESVLESRGFSDVYVRIADAYVDIVVARETLSDAELAQIEDAVRRNTGMGVSQIRVNPMRR